MNSIRELIDKLPKRSDIRVVDEAKAWRIVIYKGSDLGCEVTVPYSVLEWYAAVTDHVQKKEVWSDWMDYAGYNNRLKEDLEADMARDILAFVNRVVRAEQLFPLRIHE